MPGTLIFLIGSEGVGKTRIARALKDKYNTPEKQTIFYMSRDQGKEEIASDKTKPLSEEVKTKIYMHMLAYAKTSLEETNTEEDKIVILEGNWLTDERLEWPQLRRCLWPEKHALNFKTLILFCVCSNSNIQYNRVMNRALQKDEKLTETYPAFLKHYGDRRRQDEQAIAKLGKSVEVKRIETKGFNLDIALPYFLEALLEDIQHACKDLHAHGRHVTPSFRTMSHNSSVASLNAYDLWRNGDAAVSPNLNEFIQAMANTGMQEMQHISSLDQISLRSSPSEAILFMANSQLLDRQRLSSLDLISLQSAPGTPDEKNSKRTKMAQTPIVVALSGV
ncbi:MAG TPA: hypothetical protein VLG38_02000 [Gammaproteobacteria bacterium]|nr:hypothetical protein [Gammaproteobacteria bacterium]